jgi:hypothetical protein
MKQVLGLTIILITFLANANAIDDYHTPLLIDGKSLYPYLLNKDFSKNEASIISSLIDLNVTRATESFCKGWGYDGDQSSYTHLFLYKEALSRAHNALGKRFMNVASEVVKISKMYHEKKKPYLLFMKNKAETGAKIDKWVFESRICIQEVSFSRELSAAGIFLAIKDIQSGNDK